MTRERLKRKAITSEALDDGGKLHPKQGPGFSEILPEEDRPQPKFRVEEVDDEEKRVSKPFSTPGGKTAWADVLMRRTPPHQTYVEPYMGSASLFWEKDPSEREVLNDIDPELVEFFKFLQTGSDEDFAWMRDQTFKWSPKMFDEVKASKPNSLRGKVYRFKFLTMYSQRQRRQEITDTESVRNQTGERFLANLEKYRDRLKGVTILNDDALKIIKRFDAPGTFFYLDPPWRSESMETWKGFEVEKFQEAIGGLKGKALISFQGDLKLGDGWRRSSITRHLRGYGGYDATQQLYQNFVMSKTKKKIETDRDDLFFFFRLPDEIRNFLSDLSNKIADKKGTEVEIADHITVLFVKGDGFTDEEASKAFNAAKRILSGRQKIEAKVQGVGYFDGAQKDGEDKTALVALIDAPGLAEIHVALKDALIKSGIKAAEDQIHGFVPHATIAYLPRGERIEGLPDVKFDFPIDAVEMAHSDIKRIDLRPVSVLKIQNPKTYEPSELEDQVLRDDFRIVLAWFATWAKKPEAFKYDRATLEAVLRKILVEAMKRGPKFIQFNPDEMEESVRDFFLEVAGKVGVPDQMIKKAADITPDLDLERMSTKELVRTHFELHEMYRQRAQGKDANGLSIEDLSNLHSLVVDNLFERGVKHPAPPDDGLDDVSVDFQEHADNQPDFTKPVAKRQEQKFAKVNPSGDQLGREIKLEEVLEHLQTFKARSPYIWLVGGLAIHGKTEGDIDILVREGEDIPKSLRKVIEFRIGRALPPELSERVSIHWDKFHGPITDHIELFDLTFERINPKNEVKRMADTSEGRKLPGAMASQAERAARSDKLTLGEFFFQPKPTRPAFPEELQTVESLVDLFKANREWFPTIVQKKFDGARHQIHKDGDTIRIISEDGGDNTDRLPTVVKELRELKEDKFVLDCEIERWSGDQHLPREATAGYLNGKGPVDDGDIVVNVFDAVFAGHDIHSRPTEERLDTLRGLGIAQSTMGGPNKNQKLNLVPGVRVDNVEELERVTRKIRSIPGSEGVVAKRASAPYPLRQATPDSWVKLHNATTIKGRVIGREAKKGGGWIYQWGVFPGKTTPAKIVQAGTFQVVPVGDTFSTNLDFGIGDKILVEAETVNITNTPKGQEITAWVPRVIGPAEGGTDTVDAVARRAADNLVLQVKVVREDGSVDYLRSNVTKQADPYMEIPSEDRTYPFTVQNHFRGKSFHSDFRIGFRPEKLLLGWTMNVQVPGAIDEPVTTLAQAKAIDRDLSKVSKIDWSTGDWASRAKRGASEPVRTSIVAERKSPEPWEWMNVEGRTQEPEEGKAPPVGGTRNFPGVFDIVESGDIEFGSQKPWFHEYFVHGKNNRYRLIFRQLRLQTEKGEFLGDECMECKAKPPVVDVLWAEGMGRAWFCESCFAKWKRRMGEWAAIAGVKEVTTGRVPENWRDVHKLVELDVDPTITKAAVLPPSEGQEGEALEGPTWLAIQPDDPTPYVLDREAVNKGWIPPMGVSALPKAIRSQVPESFRFWTMKSPERVKETRDALVEAIKSGDVKIDFEASMKPVAKASLTDARFALQRQTWRGPVVVRSGPSRTQFIVRIDIGRPDLLMFRGTVNPIDNPQTAVEVRPCPHLDAIDFEGPVKPGHWMNPTKDTPSQVDILDKGKASVLVLEDDFIKVMFEGSKLKGLFELRRNPGVGGEWLMSPAEAGPATVKEAKSESSDAVDVRLDIPILKVDTDRRIVTGVVLEPDEVDAQGDTISEDAIEKAAHLFLSRFNRQTELGVMHTLFGNVGLELFESWITKIDQNLNGNPIKKGSWMMTVHVLDDRLWGDVKAGKITGFSIGGVATVV